MRLPFSTRIGCRSGRALIHLFPAQHGATGIPATSRAGRSYVAFGDSVSGALVVIRGRAHEGDSRQQTASSYYFLGENQRFYSSSSALH